jgi:hypothetical protein
MKEGRSWSQRGVFFTFQNDQGAMTSWTRTGRICWEQARSMSPIEISSAQLVGAINHNCSQSTPPLQYLRAVALCLIPSFRSLCLLPTHFGSIPCSHSKPYPVTWYLVQLHPTLLQNTLSSLCSGHTNHFCQRLLYTPYFLPGPLAPGVRSSLVRGSGWCPLSYWF